MEMAGAQFHHLGVLTGELEATLALYVEVLGYSCEAAVRDIAELEIRVASVVRDGGPRVELVEPQAGNRGLMRLRGQGVAGYHTAWAVPRLDAALAELAAKGFRALPVFESPLWGNAQCAFVMGADNTLLELIEARA